MTYLNNNRFANLKSLEIRLELFDLHHDMMNIDQLSSDGHVFERSLRENFLEAVVILDQLSQGALQQKY